jgi:hypothetical protein
MNPYESPQPLIDELAVLIARRERCKQLLHHALMTGRIAVILLGATTFALAWNLTQLPIHQISGIEILYALTFIGNCALLFYAYGIYLPTRRELAALEARLPCAIELEEFTDDESETDADWSEPTTRIGETA